MNAIADDARIREVRITLPDCRLAGDLTVPEDARGLVIFAHGSGSSRGSPRNRRVAARLNRRGFATLLFDLLSPAEADEAGGDRRFDIPFLTERLAAATGWARRQPALAGLATGYFGASTGAAAALAAAARPDASIGAVVSRGGRTDLTGPAVARVRAATLLIVGALDHPVLRWNRQTLEQLNCEKQLTVVDGATHLFPEAGALETVADLAGDWFAGHLATYDSPT